MPAVNANLNGQGICSRGRDALHKVSRQSSQPSELPRASICEVRGDRLSAQRFYSSLHSIVVLSTPMRCVKNCWSECGEHHVGRSAPEFRLSDALGVWKTFYQDQQD